MKEMKIGTERENPAEIPTLERIEPPSGSAALILGASQGIGLGFVRRLVADPAVSQVFATYRSLESAQPLLKLAQTSGDRLTIVALEITQESALADCVATIAQTLQRSGQSLGWVINCIGILHQGNLQPEKSLRQIESENLLTYFQVNSVGSVLLAKHLMPLLKDTPRTIFATLSAKVGSIGDNHLGGWYGYRASKAALNMFMRSIALEYRRTCKQTIVVVLHPGTTDTHLSKPFQRNVAPDKLFPIDRTVDQLLRVMNQLTLNDSGEFFSWDGSRLPW